MRQRNSVIKEDIQDLNWYHASGLITHSFTTVKVRRDIIESEKKNAMNKYSKYNKLKNPSKGSHILRK